MTLGIEIETLNLGVPKGGSSKEKFPKGKFQKGGFKGESSLLEFPGLQFGYMYKL